MVAYLTLLLFIVQFILNVWLVGGISLSPNNVTGIKRPCRLNLSLRDFVRPADRPTKQLGRTATETFKAAAGGRRQGRKVSSSFSHLEPCLASVNLASPPRKLYSYKASLLVTDAINRWSLPDRAWSPIRSAFV